MKTFPKISIITCIYKGERIINEYLEYLFKQDYPFKKIELILADGGNSKETLEIIEGYIKKYPKIIKLIKNPMSFKVGKGNGADIASRKASGEIIFLLDQDNILIQKNWLKRMVQILMENKDVSAVQSRMAIPNKGSFFDKYLSAIGIEDPFAIPYSLNSQITFNPNKFDYDKKKKIFKYIINKNNFYYAGDNGFAIRKKEFFENGGYTQDIDNFYRMALSKKKYKIAIPKEIKLYHKTSTLFFHFIKKRNFYIQRYILKNYEERDFYWFNLKKNNFNQNKKFIETILFNLLFVPGVIEGIKMAIKKRKIFWIIHPFVLFLVTINYIYSFLYAKIVKKEKTINL